MLLRMYYVTQQTLVLFRKITILTEKLQIQKIPIVTML